MSKHPDAQADIDPNLFLANVNIKPKKLKIVNIHSKINLKKLKDDNYKKRFNDEIISNTLNIVHKGEVNTGWRNIKNTMLEAGKKILGEEEKQQK